MPQAPWTPWTGLVYLKLERFQKATEAFEDAQEVVPASDSMKRNIEYADAMHKEDGLWLKVVKLNVPGDVDALLRCLSDRGICSGSSRCACPSLNASLQKAVDSQV